MQKVEILVRTRMRQLEVQKILKTWAERQNADVKPMGRLVRRHETKGESMHWHIAGRTKGMGTVEATYLPSTGRLTVLVHDNRRGFWAGQAYKELASEIRLLLEETGPGLR